MPDSDERTRLKAAGLFESYEKDRVKHALIARMIRQGQERNREFEKKMNRSTEEGRRLVADVLALRAKTQRVLFLGFFVLVLNGAMVWFTWPRYSETPIVFFMFFLSTLLGLGLCLYSVFDARNSIRRFSLRATDIEEDQGRERQRRDARTLISPEHPLSKARNWPAK